MNLRKALMITAVIFTANATAAGADFKPANQTNLTKLCMTALSGNRAAMHNGIKESGFTKEFVSENIKCNGVSLSAFVQQHGQNSEAMLRVLERARTNTSITDIAKNNLHE